MELPVHYPSLHYSERKKVRDEYVAQQNGVCWYCKMPLTGKPSKSVLDKKINKKLFPNGFFDWPVHLHHDHDTNLTIGAVHCVCNAVLWQYHGE